MKIIDIVKLAFLNILSHLKMVFCILVGFIIIMQIMMVSSGYGYAMNRYINDIIQQNVSGAYCYSAFGNLNDSQLKSIWSDKHIEGIQTLKTYQIFEYCRDNNKTIDAAYVINNDILVDAARIEINGNLYFGENDFSYDFNADDVAVASRTDKIVMLDIGVMEIGDNLQFSKSEFQEYSAKYSKNSAFIAGGQFTKERQIIISDYMLQRFHITLKPEDCIGQTVRMYVDTADGLFLIVDSYEICGVIDSNFNRIHSRTSYPQILLSSPVNDFHIVSRERIYGHSFMDIASFYNKNEGKFENLMIDASTVEYAEIETQQLLFNEVILVICGMIIIAVIVFVYIMIYFYFKKRTRYVCIQKAMGFHNGALYLLIFSELFIIEIFAIIIDVPVFYTLVKSLNRVIQTAVSENFVVSQNDFLIATMVGGVFMLLMITVISLGEYVKTKKYTVVNREKLI